MAFSSEQRRAPRVSYRSQARLQVRPGEQGFEAEIHNLSTTGMFLIADHVPAAGACVRCHVFLGSEPCTLQGKVAWVRPDWRPHGTRAPTAGIEFVDLDRRVTAALRGVLGTAWVGSENDPQEPLQEVLPEASQENKAPPDGVHPARLPVVATRLSTLPPVPSESVEDTIPNPIAFEPAVTLPIVSPDRVSESQITLALTGFPSNGDLVVRPPISAKIVVAAGLLLLGFLCFGSW